MVMGEDMPLLRMFSATSGNGVPVAATLFQLAAVTALMLTRSFEAVLDFIQFSLTFCSFLTVLGVIVLRYRQPDLPRPYRAWGYPLTPLIFLAVTLFVLVHLVTERPLQSFASFCTMLAGLLLYGISVRHRRGTLRETS
ncbi:MAG: amino acid permease, partial [Rhodomicrobium sp.]|nr:amino acid permease [Rhodomicrobium sp.]